MDTGMLPADAKALEARAVCRNWMCTRRAVKDLRLHGFAGLDEQWIGFCGPCVQRIQWAFVDGTTTVLIAEMLGLEPPQ